LDSLYLLSESTKAHHLEANPNLSIKAFPLNKVDEDQRFEYYDLSTSEPIDFVVNRIQWIPVFMDPDAKV